MTEEYKGYKIEVVPDQDPESPRNWEPLGKMCCFHGRYTLGDKDPGYRQQDYSSWAGLKEALVRDGAALILPLYLYDHSGITMKTTPFGDRWDSGQVGFIYATQKDILAAYGGKRLSTGKLERAKRVLEGEVETYDKYISGEVYGYRILKDGEEVDSCWGYYGDDECLKAARETVDQMGIPAKSPVGDPGGAK